MFNLEAFKTKLKEISLLIIHHKSIPNPSSLMTDFLKNFEPILSRINLLSMASPASPDSSYLIFINLLKQAIKISLGLQDKTQFPSEREFSLQAQRFFHSTDPAKTNELIRDFYSQLMAIEPSDYPEVSVCWQQFRESLALLDVTLAACVDEGQQKFLALSSAAVLEQPEIINEVTNLTRKKSWEITALQRIFEELVETHNGNIEIHEGRMANTVSIIVKGSASFIYSVYSPFFNADNHLEESRIGKQIEGKFFIILDGLKQKIQERNSLKFVQDYLLLQGFEVKTGQKPAPRVFPENEEFKQQNSIAFKNRFGISLELGNLIHAEVSSIITMPFAIAAETSNIELKDDLNFCFRELRLVGANGQAKECIDLKDGRFLANIGSSQAVNLEKHFQQRAMLLLKSDEHQIKSIRDAGGPVLAIDKIRATLISMIQLSLENHMDAPLKLTTLAQTQPTLLIRGHQTNTQAEFVHNLEQIINKICIFGPNSFDLFLSPSDSIPPNEALEKLMRFLSESQDPSVKDATYIPHQPTYTRQYPKFDAPNNIAYQLKALNPTRTDAERREIVSNCGKVSHLLQQLRDFRTQHSPFYLIQQINDKLQYCLQTANQEKINEILLTLGLSEAEMNCFKITGPNLSRYNTYHIEFILPLLIINFCLNHAILMRPQYPLQAYKEYLYDPYNRLYAKSNDDACRALEWLYNQVFMCSWTAGQPKKYDYSNYGSFFGGSSTNTNMGTRYTPPSSTSTTSSSYSSS